MTYPTHKQYAISFAFVASMLIYRYGVSQINYYLALPIILLVAKYGALFPDIDHSWQNVKEKTVPNWIINKVIHLTGGRHRAWQTHSIDIVVVFSIFSYLIPNILFNDGTISEVNKEVAIIILAGFCSGWISHIIADMMTSAGVRLFCWNKNIIIRLVPRKIGQLKFNTGHEWEEFVFSVSRTINMVLGVICILYPLDVPSLIQELISSI